MKTPEQMAEDYAKTIRIYDYHTLDGVDKSLLRKGFLAGYQAAKDEMNSSGKPDSWISVKDRLPEVGAPCLVTCHEERYTIAEYDGIKWTTLNSIAYYHPIVTHWQWLPEIPKEEG